MHKSSYPDLSPIEYILFWLRNDGTNTQFTATSLFAPADPLSPNQFVPNCNPAYGGYTMLYSMTLCDYDESVVDTLFFLFISHNFLPTQLNDQN